MKNKLFYPAVFEPEEDGGFTVDFPDIPGCYTQGENLEDCYEMAFDVLGLCLSVMEDQKETIPTPSNPQDIPVEKGQFVAVIEFDLAAYNRKHNSKAVKKTLSIPQWLNEEAMKHNINFSQTLQEGLMNKLKTL